MSASTHTIIMLQCHVSYHNTTVCSSIFCPVTIVGVLTHTLGMQNNGYMLVLDYSNYYML
jgi:hypothetical protein